jgi:hypothetical protein
MNAPHTAPASLFPRETEKKKQLEQRQEPLQQAAFPSSVQKQMEDAVPGLL